MRKLPLIVVEWEDATSRSSWEDEKDADFKVSLNHSMGWRIRCDRKYVLLIRQRGEFDDCADRLKIPRGCIRSIRRIE